MAKSNNKISPAKLKERLQEARRAAASCLNSESVPKRTRGISKALRTAREKTIKKLHNELQKQLDRHTNLEDADLSRLTLDFLHNQFPPLKKNTRLNELKALALQATIQKNLAHLEMLADQGEPVAIGAYVEIAHECVMKLNRHLAPKCKDAILPISRKCLNWPVLASSQKAFGDDVKGLIQILEVGQDSIANDPTARFNPNSKFGKVAFDIIKRIDEGLATEPSLWNFGLPPNWITEAKKLPPLNEKIAIATQEEWLKVVENILKDDFSNPEKANSYQDMIPVGGKRKRWKSVFTDKIRWEFYSFWGIHRKSN